MERNELVEQKEKKCKMNVPLVHNTSEREGGREEGFFFLWDTFEMGEEN